MKNFLWTLLLWTAIVGAQSNSNWNTLISSAHEIGYCLYHLDEVFCNAHLSRYNELLKNSESHEDELNYFTMKEEWARKRIEDWANSQALPKASLLLFFNINQGFEGDTGKFNSKPHGFFIVSLKNDLQFKVLNRYKKLALMCSIFHKDKPNILYNIMWREFMSGRIGLIENEVEFIVSNKHNINRYFKIFKTEFFKYQKSKFE